MGNLFGSPAAAILPKDPATPAPTALNDTGSKIVTGTDALARLNERTSGKKTKEALAKTTKVTGVAGLGGVGEKTKKTETSGNFI